MAPAGNIGQDSLAALLGQAGVHDRIVIQSERLRGATDIYYQGCWRKKPTSGHVAVIVRRHAHPACRSGERDLVQPSESCCTISICACHS